MMSVSRSRPWAALVAVPGSSVFTIRGYRNDQTPGTFHKWKRDLLDQIDDRLTDNLPSERALVAVDNSHSNVLILIPDHLDAVMFKLAWAEVIASLDANQVSHLII
ncbi:hypothetical protein KB221_08230 [Aquidulcibacter paucihalophilus]|nr:hypothetical protein KB221_08230 [Aquidulcibacter paucihalophilus]